MPKRDGKRFNRSSDYLDQLANLHFRSAGYRLIHSVTSLHFRDSLALVAFKPMSNWLHNYSW